MDSFGLAYFSSILIIGVVALVLNVMAQWMIFSKAGKPGWASLIPIYNFIVLLEVVGKPWWWLFLMFIPVVNFVIAIIIYHHLSLSFGKGAGFTVGLVFLNLIFMLILAFGDAKYVGPEGQ